MEMQNNQYFIDYDPKTNSFAECQFIDGEIFELDPSKEHNIIDWEKLKETEPVDKKFFIEDGNTSYRCHFIYPDCAMSPDGTDVLVLELPKNFRKNIIPFGGEKPFQIEEYINLHPDFETDIEEGKYQKYLDDVPVTELFSSIMHYAAYTIDREMIDELISRGLDINAEFDYPNDAGKEVVPLESLGEWRHYSAMKVLLDAGADPNLGNVASAVLGGHNYDYVHSPESADEAKAGIKMLSSFGLVPKIDVDDIDFYKELKLAYSKSQYLVRFLDACIKQFSE